MLHNDPRVSQTQVRVPTMARTRTALGTLAFAALAAALAANELAPVVGRTVLAAWGQ
jgi:hypothetical protein